MNDVMGGCHDAMPARWMPHRLYFARHARVQGKAMEKVLSKSPPLLAHNLDGAQRLHLLHHLHGTPFTVLVVGLPGPGFVFFQLLARLLELVQLLELLLHLDLEPRTEEQEP